MSKWECNYPDFIGFQIMIYPEKTMMLKYVEAEHIRNPDSLTADLWRVAYFLGGPVQPSAWTRNRLTPPGYELLMISYIEKHHTLSNNGQAFIHAHPFSKAIL
jgi:hypothetical protein